MYLSATRPTMAAGAWAVGFRSVRLPTELWGAVNAVRRAIAPLPPRTPKPTTHHTHRVAAGVGEPLIAPAEGPPLTFSGPRHDLVALLDTRPALTLLEAIVCLLVTALLCTSTYASVYGLSHPLSLRVALRMAALAVTSLTILRGALLQRQYQALQRDAQDLGDADSLFLPLLGVTVHAKATPSSTARLVSKQDDRSLPVGVHCYHGFGANTASWDLLRPRLAASLGGLVSCHDMPGFGLTSRPGQLSQYSLSFNGALGRAVLDSQGHQGARVLIGHSLGSACVAAEVIDNPKGIDAVVLIAPAIVAPRGGAAKGVAAVEQVAASPGVVVTAASPYLSSSSSSVAAAATSPPRRMLAPLLVTVARALLILLRPLLVLLLRSAVHSRRFWEKGLKSSWFDPNGVSPALVNAYRLPQLVKGWEAGMLRFLYARMSILSPVMRGLAPSAAEGDDSQLGRFAATVAAAGIPVLLIHGADDALVPLRNSQALESLVPGAQLVVLPRCGHTPQEEMPQRVSDEVDAFLRARGVVGSSRV